MEFNTTETGGSALPGENNHFIKEIINKDRSEGKHGGRVATRFPPEPNGYLHIGHAKSIVLNFGLARHYGGTCNLRFDDTNPTKEEVEYVDSIKEDVAWLGFTWDGLFFASDYFEQMYGYAVDLIKKGKAYVCHLSTEESRALKGDWNTPGQDSPYRERSVEENLDLFARMRAGEFAEGECVLRAKIDMASPNMNMRDPAIYRIRHVDHHRTGSAWCIYPMYDFAHGLEDSIEGITHSICTLEFEDHRPLYDWFLNELEIFHPQQIEFARLNLTYTVMSKRKLLQLVTEKLVEGWDDPRMPTISGLRRRGYTPEAMRKFCERIGVAKRDSTVDVALLEHTIREDLNETSPRVMAVLDPLKITITNYPEGEVEYFEAPYFPDEPERGVRKIPFSGHLLIEREDFREDPPRKWHRLSPGAEIRLRYACLITCHEVIKNENGEVIELKCTYDPDSRGGTAPDGRKVRGTSHWVSEPHAVKAQVRIYDRLFSIPEPDSGDDYRSNINPDSLSIVEATLEPCMGQAKPMERFQFERLGYFVVDKESDINRGLVFNRTVSLRDSWAKVERSAPAASPVVKTPEEPGVPEITFDDFARVQLKIGVILEAQTVEGADKLLRLRVQVGENDIRQVLAGIRLAYPDEQLLVGKKVSVVTNLKPRKMKFGVSEAMILAASGGDGRLNIISVEGDVKPGDTIS